VTNDFHDLLADMKNDYDIEKKIDEKVDDQYHKKDVEKKNEADDWRTKLQEKYTKMTLEKQVETYRR